jgi:hypothetical protein
LQPPSLSGKSLAMNGNPIDLALQHISETKHLLDGLLTSSEQFDYPKAKVALQALHRKARELSKVRAELESLSTVHAPANVVMLSSHLPASRARQP